MRRAFTRPSHGKGEKVALLVATRIGDSTAVLALVSLAALVAVAYGGLLTRWVLAANAGNETMGRIARAIQEGAAAYLNRQYSVIAVIGIVLALVIMFAVNWETGVLYIVGAGCSALAGYVGMNLSVRANVRTAQAATRGLDPALQLAFRGGAVTRLFVVGLRLLGVAGPVLGLSEAPSPLRPAVRASPVNRFPPPGGGLLPQAARCRPVPR